MRLIDADLLKKVIHSAYSDDLEILDKIDEQSTAFDVDKVVEQFKKEKNPIYRTDGSLMGERKNIEIDKAIEIVKGSGIE